MTTWQSHLLKTLDDRAVLIVKDTAVTSHKLRSDAAALAETISTNQWSRIAWIAPSVSQVIAAIDACQETGTDLFLIREPREWNASQCQAYQINAVFHKHDQPNEVFPQHKCESQNEIFLTTSGTGGQAKWISRSLESLQTTIRDSKTLDTSDSWLLTYSPTSFAGIQVILTALSTGSQIITVQKNTLAELVEAFTTHCPTHVSGTPSFWRGLIASLKATGPTHSPQQITLGGELSDQTTLTALKLHFPDARIVHIYATTELGVLFTVRDGFEGFPATWLTKEVFGSRFRIKNEELQVLRTGDPNDASSVSTDWQSTGDLVEAKGDRVYFQGRVDGLINVGGLKVKPEFVESTLLQHPLVADVRIFGEPSSVVGSIVAAEVVLNAQQNADHDDISDEPFAFAAQRLPPHMVPRMIHFSPELKLNATGKKPRHL